MQNITSDDATKKCFKCNHNLVDSLNVVYNPVNSTTVLWNKFQILVYENFCFENAIKVLDPEFAIQQVVLSNNYMLCLDTMGNVHSTSLKFKSSAQKRFKSSFQYRDQSVLICINFNENILSLKFDFNSYYLCLHEINSEFRQKSKTALKYDEFQKPAKTHSNCLLKSQSISEDDFKYLKDVFKTEAAFSNHNIVLVSFDKLTIYGCILDLNSVSSEDSINLVKFYSCPTDICDIEIIINNELYIIICLKIGTVIKLSLQNQTDPLIVHLNSAIYKFTVMSDTIIYTDGQTFWKSEDVFTKSVKFSQFFVKNIRDFVKFGDQVICTTFTNLIYLFSIDDEQSYLKTTTHDYCLAENVYNSEHYHTIFGEGKKNDEIIAKAEEESKYLTALSLSKRPDVIDRIVKYKIIVYDSYEDVIKENAELTLTEEAFQYYNANLLLIKISICEFQYVFNVVIKTLLERIKFHVTLFSDNKLLKTTSIKILNEFNKVNYLIPFKTNNMLTEVKVNIKIIFTIPGVFDRKENVWAIMQAKEFIINSEHFIKTNSVSSNIYLKNPHGNTEELVQSIACNLYRNVFKFSNISNNNNPVEWNMYVKLPNNYNEILKNMQLDCFPEYKTNYLSNELVSSEFLNSKHDLCFEISKEKVKLVILNDEISNVLLKVTSRNVKIASHIRNFISNLIYNTHSNYCVGKEFVAYSLYTTVENLQKSIKDFIIYQGSVEDLILLAEKFQECIIGSLPL